MACDELDEPLFADLKNEVDDAHEEKRVFFGTCLQPRALQAHGKWKYPPLTPTFNVELVSHSGIAL